MRRERVVVVRARRGCAEGCAGLGFRVGARRFEIPAVGHGLGFGLVQRLLRDRGAELQVRERGCDFWLRVGGVIEALCLHVPVSLGVLRTPAMVGRF